MARGGLRCNLIRKAWDRYGTGGPVQEERRGKKAVWVGPAPTKTENKAGGRGGGGAGGSSTGNAKHGLTVQVLQSSGDLKAKGRQQIFAE